MFVLPVHIRGHVGNPYIGILVFIMIPNLLCRTRADSLRIFLGRRRIRKGLAQAVTDPKLALRRLAWFLGSATVLNLILGTQFTYWAVEHMESVQFCGQTCHVMTPELSARGGQPVGDSLRKSGSAPGRAGLVTDYQIEGDFPKFGNNDNRVDQFATWVVSTSLEEVSHVSPRAAYPVGSDDHVKCGLRQEHREYSRRTTTRRTLRSGGIQCTAGISMASTRPRRRWRRSCIGTLQTASTRAGQRVPNRALRRAGAGARELFHRADADGPAVLAWCRGDATMTASRLRGLRAYPAAETACDA